MTTTALDDKFADSSDTLLWRGGRLVKTDAGDLGPLSSSSITRTKLDFGELWV